ncbi:MAG: hypothetical protein HY077_12050 [Elusimicrobia bacterium]|nr:hypothetical protein [Elusimicrobiota bacterium]
MLNILGVLLLLLVPFVIYMVQHQQANNPSLRWPKLAQMLGLQYQKDPPRIAGQWHGRAVAVDLQGEGARISCGLLKPSRLRVEVGPKDLVTKRSGVVVPDPVATGDSAFDERLLARVSDKAAGAKMMDPMLRQRLLALKNVDVVGQGGAVQWTMPAVTDPDELEEILKLMGEIASEMEGFPA